MAIDPVVSLTGWNQWLERGSYCLTHGNVYEVSLVVQAVPRNKCLRGQVSGMVTGQCCWDLLWSVV